MKKIIIILMLALLPGLAVAGWGGSNWDNYFGTSTNPIIAAYYNTLYANSILPLTPNTGSIGSAANAFDSQWADSFYTNPNIGGLNSWCGIMSSASGGEGGLISSDSTSGQTRVTTKWRYNRAVNSWYTDKNLQTTTAMNAGSYMQAVTYMNVSGAGGYMAADTFKTRKGFITDSTAYVLKRIFMRNDSLFFVVNTDTFRVVKK